MYKQRRVSNCHAQKLSSLTMILVVGSSEDDLKPRHFYFQGARFNVIVYTEVLNLCVTLC